MKRLPVFTIPAALAAFTLAIAVPRLHADIEEVRTNSFPVAPGGRLVMEVDRGSIDVQGTQDASVQVVVTRKAVARSDARARELLEAHEVKCRHDGNQVEVRARMLRESWGSWFRGGQNLQVRYQVSVPSKFDLQLQTAGGSVKISSIQGDVQSTTSGGSLTFKEITGPVRGSTSGGSITASDCTGDLKTQTSGGAIRLEAIDGAVHAETSGGSIQVRKLTGKTTLHTSGGSIHLDNVVGPTQASTSGGSITAAFSEPPQTDCILKTSGGGITVTLPENAGAELDAETSGGRVSSDHPVTSVLKGEARRNVLQGKIAGGGPLLKLRTSGGSIRVKK